MSANTSSIDDLLLNSSKPQNMSESTQTPDSPEQKSYEKVYDNNNDQNANLQVEDAPVAAYDQKNREADSSTSEANNEKQNTHAEDENSRFDEYGNETSESDSYKPKTYTEDEVNERINHAVRERLARIERNQNNKQQPSQQEVKQAEDAGFDYDPNSQQDWQQQLKQFIKQTNDEIQQEQLQKQHQQQEQQRHQEFQQKFQKGMSKFKDFREVVGSQPITDAMTLATRQMKDPASFLYAASKRHSDELQRISQMGDSYGQMVEIGKLEERMKKSNKGTNAPKPIDKTKEDTTLNEPSEPSEPTIEDLIAESERKRLNRMRGSRR